MADVEGRRAAEQQDEPVAQTCGDFPSGVLKGCEWGRTKCLDRQAASAVPCSGLGRGRSPCGRQTQSSPPNRCGRASSGFPKKWPVRETKSTRAVNEVSPLSPPPPRCASHQDPRTHLHRRKSPERVRVGVRFAHLVSKHQNVQVCLLEHAPAFALRKHHATTTKCTQTQTQTQTQAQTNSGII